MPSLTRTRAAGAYAALAVTDSVLAGRPGGSHRARLATKPLLMPTLAARVLDGPPAAGRGTVLTAQAFSWGGDLALLREGRRPFLAGLSSFLAAHVAYLAAYRARSSAPVLATAGRRRFLAFGGAASTGLALAAGGQDRALAAPVAAYGLTLATMVAAAAAVDPQRGRAEVLTGASLFMLSDTLLGVRTFLLRDRAPRLETAVMATYTAAQWCISEGLTRP